MYTVDGNIPMPPGGGSGGGRGKYPWHLLKVGDSFFVPRNDFRREDYRPKPAVGMNIKVATRKLCENNIWEIRVWRTL